MKQRGRRPSKPGSLYKTLTAVRVLYSQNGAIVAVRKMLPAYKFDAGVRVIVRLDRLNSLRPVTDLHTCPAGSRRPERPNRASHSLIRIERKSHPKP